jgi:YfiH family protein
MVKYWQMNKRFGCDVLEFNFLNEYGIKHGIVVKTEGHDIDEDAIYSGMTSKSNVVVTSQVHGVNIGRVDPTFDRFYPEKIEADGLMTDRSDVMLTIHTADCVPIFLSSCDGKCVALVHAGWKGTTGNIAALSVESFCSEYDISPSEMLAVIGPCIEKKCYQVGTEVAKLFDPAHIQSDSNDKYLLDLRSANRNQLLASGIKPCSIYVSDLCTRCQPEMFHSFRREGKLKGKMISYMEARDD